MILEHPVFLVGSGRSGSTLVARLLSHHPDFSYLTYLSREFPHRPGLTRLAMRILSVPGGRAMLRSRGQINEAWEFWEHHAKGFANPMRDITADDVTPYARDSVRRAIATVVGPSRPRFFAKITGWGRIGYLHAVFPGARFVHLVRDGRDVANSLLRVPFWNGRRGPSNWRFGPLEPQDREIWERHDRSFVALAGLAWKILVRSVEVARKNLPETQFHEMRFEDFLADPSRILRDVLQFCDLPWSPEVRDVIDSTDFRDPTNRYREDLNPRQQEILVDVLADELKRYGYD